MVISIQQDELLAVIEVLVFSVSASATEISTLYHQTFRKKGATVGGCCHPIGCQRECVDVFVSCQRAFDSVAVRL